jgi:hypothetical protein
VTPKERKNLRVPEDVVVRQELDDDEIAEVERWWQRARREVAGGAYAIGTETGGAGEGATVNSAGDTYDP